jgi:hypothetical protein
VNKTEEFEIRGHRFKLVDGADGMASLEEYIDGTWQEVAAGPWNFLRRVHAPALAQEEVKP